MDVYQKTTAFYRRANTEKTIYGKSVLDRELHAVKLGAGKPVGIAVYAVHGREFITAELAFHHYGRAVTGSVWLLPLVNPDGALLSQIGLQSVAGGEERAFLCGFSQAELRLWKANARGVDLNVNFDADFGKGVRNLRTRGAENCIGDYPFSEKETQALRDFTLSVAPDYTVSYHSKGEEIYWYYGQNGVRLVRDYRIAQKLSDSCGYPLKQAYGSVGGYKDWCIQTLKIPAFTIEVGSDGLTHPLCGEETIKKIIDRNGKDLCVLSKAVKEYR